MKGFNQLTNKLATKLISIFTFRYETLGKCSRAPADSVDRVNNTVIATPIRPSINSSGNHTPT